MMNFRIIGVTILMSLFGHQILAQDQTILNQLREEEQSTIEAIALYPENERLAILTASMHPEILVRIQTCK